MDTQINDLPMLAKPFHYISCLWDYNMKLLWDMEFIHADYI